MSDRVKLMGPVVVLAFLIGGCGESEVSHVPPADIVGAEQRIEILRRQIEARYESPQAHYELGRIYHDSGQWRKAEEEYRIAVEFDPVLWDAEVSLVKLYQDRGDQAGAKEIAEAAIDRAALSAELLLGLAEAFEKEYFDDYALKCHSRALALAPDSPDVYKRIGLYYLARRDRSRAEANLRRSFQLDPYQPDVAGELGRLGVIVEVPGVEVGPAEKEPAPQGDD